MSSCSKTPAATFVGYVALVLAVGLSGCAPADSSEAGEMSEMSEMSQMPTKPAFNAEGQLTRPEGYREWVYIGTPLTPNDLNPPEAAFPEFHNVYMHPSDFAAYKETGEMPDGTILVKELVSVGSKQAASGNGYFMGEFIGLEATVKDATRFAAEPGNWAYFSYGHAYPLAESAPAQPTAACNGCHLASAAEDFVFSQYYPVMGAAKPGAGMGAGEK